MVDEEITEERHTLESSPTEWREAIEVLLKGTAESGLGRRTLIKLSLLPALGLLVAPVIVLLRDLGPLPVDSSLPHRLAAGDAVGPGTASGRRCGRPISRSGPW